MAVSISFHHTRTCPRFIHSLESRGNNAYAYNVLRPWQATIQIGRILLKCGVQNCCRADRAQTLNTVGMTTAALSGWDLPTQHLSLHLPCKCTSQCITGFPVPLPPSGSQLVAAAAASMLHAPLTCLRGPAAAARGSVRGRVTKLPGMHSAVQHAGAVLEGWCQQCA